MDHAAHGNHQQIQNPLQWGPMPPRARRMQLVWPRDKNQKGVVGSWRRWKDLFTNKGPDIWLSVDELGGPSRPVWSNWMTPMGQVGNPHLQEWDNLGYQYRRGRHVRPFFFADRDHHKKYDFRTRKYKRPDVHTWSDAKYCKQHDVPIYTRDTRGRACVHPEYDGGENYWDPRRNAFAYDPHDPVWRWHERPGWHDEL